ncbi:MAG: GNAT family N-acetyltransferase [Turicibacter sp.]|nr:GNAT family N-acetyltransferase [Turicibacter sp.]
MITTARNLTIKELLSEDLSDAKNSLWCKEDQMEIFTHRSWVSIYMILQYIKNQTGKFPVIYVPELYCYDTINQIEPMAKIVYYKITRDLLPDFKECAKWAKVNPPDVFVFVHFFGNVYNASEAKVFCENSNSILIEDAAHVLLPVKKVGRYGHFTIYSPWKLYGIIDGAILIINKKAKFKKPVEEVKKDLELIQNDFLDVPEKMLHVWKLKKIMQKIIPNKKKFHTAKESDKNTTILIKSEKLYKISLFSKNILLHIREENILQLAQRKKENYNFILEYLKRIDGVEPAFDCSNNIPYALVIKVSDRETKKRIIEKFNIVGKIVNEWPMLSPIIDDNSLAAQFKRETLLISIHDGIDFQILKRKLKIIDTVPKTDNKLFLEEISQQNYEELCNQTARALPLLQSIGYTNAKAQAQRWKVNYWRVYKGDKIEDTVAFFITLNKYRFLYRINQGPVFNQDMEAETYALIKKRFSGFGKVLFIAPNSKRSGKNFLMFLCMGFRYRKKYYSTGFIDLKNEKETIRKQMNSAWRNSLKSSEKKKLTVEYAINREDFEALLHLHSIDKGIRNYGDSGDDITRQLFINGHMLGICARNDNQDNIAFIMIALHSKTATYYIGWSNEEGYKSNANRLLLWKAIEKLKELGVEWLDLGGVDWINTRSIADFKIGSGCNLFQYVGEYVIW